MRTIIEMPDPLLKSLDRLRKEEKRSRAELIREAVTEYLNRKNRTTAEQAFGIWKHRGMDGVDYQNEIRGEWDRA